jgi:hypothetical protein
MVQPGVVLVSPVLLLGLDRMRRACRGRSRAAFAITELVAVGLAVADPLIGYARGTFLGAATAFLGIPVYATAMKVWSHEHGPGSSISRRWLLARRWSLVFAAIIVTVWGFLVERRIDKGYFDSITISGGGPIFATILTLGLILPGMIATTAVAANGTRHSLKMRPGRSIS